MIATELYGPEHSALDASTSLGFVPSWMEGESLYGWAARYHRVYGEQEKATGMNLFGRAHACRLRDVPTGLDRFYRSTGGHLGDVESILQERTPVGFYWAMLSSVAKSRVVHAAKSYGGVSIPFALGLPAARMGATHPLAHCIDCDEAARRDGGTPTWKIRFQLPGAWLCPIHERPLRRLTSRRSYWESPDECAAAEMPSPTTSTELRALLQLASQSWGLFRCTHVDLPALRHATLYRLRSMGLCTSDRRLSSRRVQTFFDASPIATLMRRHPDAQRPPRGSWIADLLRGRAACHPTKWLLLWNALVWDIEEVGTCSLFEDALRGLSPFRLDPQQALWDSPAEPLGVQAPEHVQKAFADARTLSDAGIALGISSSAAKRWLEDYPNLLADWKVQRFEYRLKQARLNLSNALQSHPSLDRAGLMRMCRADTEWLRKHAPRTLRVALDRIPSTRNRQSALF